MDLYQLKQNDFLNLMIKPKVSIIVPIYNVEKYLDRCMQSLLNQTLKEIEIILVDDESPDNCPAMCDEYARHDARVKVIHKNNGGLGFARNSGLEVATGEYVAFVDSDDYVNVTMYEELYQEAKQKELDVLFCNFYRRNKNGNVDEVREVRINEYYNETGDIFIFLLNMIGTEPKCSEDRIYSMSVWHGIYSTKIIRDFEIKFPSEREIISEDIFFHINFLSHSKSIGYINYHHYFYCENGSSLTQSYRKDRFEKYKILHEETCKLLLNLYPENKEIILLSVDRLFLGYIRSMVLTFKFGIEDLDEILADSYLRTIVKRYPYTRLPIKHHLFFLILKYKFSSLVLMLNNLKKLK